MTTNWLFLAITGELLRELMNFRLLSGTKIALLFFVFTGLWYVLIVFVCVSVCLWFYVCVSVCLRHEETYKNNTAELTTDLSLAVTPSLPPSLPPSPLPPTLPL
jgi:hypothetical protein